jgi:hypothetical protein
MTTQRNRPGNGGPVSCRTRECEPGLEHHFRGLNSEWSHGSAGGALGSGLLDPRIC